MRKATIMIERDTDAALARMGQGIVQAWKTGKSDEDVFSFESPAALFRTLTQSRCEMLARLQDIGASSIRGLARELDRDLHRVHDDVEALRELGLVEDTEDGKVHVPYGVIHVAGFDLTAAAAA